MAKNKLFAKITLTKNRKFAFLALVITCIMNITTFFQVSDISPTLMTFGITTSIISIIILGIMAFIIPTSNVIWNLIFTLTFITQGFTWSLYHKNGLILHFFLIVSGLLSSRLADFKINRQTIIISIFTYVSFGTLISLDIISYKFTIVPFLVMALGVLFIQLQLMHLIKQFEHYKKIIAGNTESSQSMLRLIERKKSEAEAANNAKSAFLANMSHEIRTPINTILGLDEMILRECYDEKILNYAKNIKNASNMLLSLVNDILDFSKIENGKMEIIPDEYSLFSMLNELVTITELRAKNKGLQFYTDFSPELPCSLYGDEIRIKQVITNLLINAVKYTKDGSITFKIAHKEIADKKIKLFIEIIDTGIGIKPEDISKLFNKFERIEENKNRNIEGSGLGINITENLLNMMGSHLIVNSEYNVGSSFSFELEQDVIDNTPISNISYFDEKVRQNIPTTFIAEQVNILIVDDNEMNLFIAKELLKHTQMKISTATSGAKCLEMAHDKLFTLILMDHMMPDLDGIKTLELLRADNTSASQNIPVIALTANAIHGAKDFYLNAGFADYLTKPIESKKLENTLLKFIDNKLVTFVSRNNSDSTTKYHQEEETQHIDIQTGISYTYNKENYMELLKMFDEKSTSRFNEIVSIIEKCNEDNCKNYTIAVHSLKNTAAMIGAKQLSEIALKLELAARKNDIKFIESLHYKLLDEYKCVEKEVKNLLTAENKK